MTKKHLHKLGLSLTSAAILAVHTGLPTVIAVEKLHEDAEASVSLKNRVTVLNDLGVIDFDKKHGNVGVRIIDIDRPDMPEGVLQVERDEVGIKSLDVEKLGFYNYRIVSGDAMDMDIGGSTFSVEFKDDGGDRSNIQTSYTIRVTHKDNLESETPTDPEPEEPETPTEPEEPEAPAPDEEEKRDVELEIKHVGVRYAENDPEHSNDPVERRVLDVETIKGKQGDEVSYNVKEFSNYTSQLNPDLDYTTILDYREASIEILYNYKGEGDLSDGTEEVEETGKTYVHYKDIEAEGVLLEPSYLLEGKLGEDWVSEEKEFKGYQLKEVKGSKQGKFTEKDQEVTYLYEKIGETEQPSDSEKRYVSMIDQVVRHLPNDRASDVTFIQDGDTVELIDAHDLKWFKVKVNGEEGYVLRGNVTSEKNYNSGDTTLQDLTVTKKENQAEYIVAVKTPLRTGNADRYRPLKVMDRSDIVKYEGTTEDGKWFKVDHKGTKGFVKRSDVTTKKNYEDGSPAVDLNTFSQMAKNQKLRTMIDSSIRTQAGQQYRVLDELPRNTTVIYKGTVKANDDWFKVEMNGEMGYVFRGDLTKVQR